MSKRKNAKFLFFYFLFHSVTRENIKKKKSNKEKAGPAPKKRGRSLRPKQSNSSFEKKMKVYNKQMAQEQKKKSALFPLSL